MPVLWDSIKYAFDTTKARATTFLRNGQHVAPTSQLSAEPSEFMDFDPVHTKGGGTNAHNASIVRRAAGLPHADMNVAMAVSGNVGRKRVARIAVIGNGIGMTSGGPGLHT